MTTAFERYELSRRIGRGGMAVVYLARHVALGREVAVKQLNVLGGDDDPQFAARFLREARTAGRLSHPRIVGVFDYFEHDGSAYIVMDYAEGGSLRRFVGTLSLAQFAGVMEGVLAGLAHSGRRNIVHRDLKPENLLVGSDGHIQIADFGIAKALGVTMTSGSLTAPGATIGTPQYMSPEQATDSELSPQSDLYSLGVIAYELLVGRTPFSETTAPLAVLMHHVNDPPPDPRQQRPDLDAELTAWVLRLLEKSPSDRPANAEEAWRLLAPVISRLLGPEWRDQAMLSVDETEPLSERSLTPAEFASPPASPVAPADSDVYRTYDPPPPPAPPVAAPEPPEAVAAEPVTPATPPEPQPSITVPPRRAPTPPADVPPEPPRASPQPAATPTPTAPSSRKPTLRAPVQILASAAVLAFVAGAIVGWIRWKELVDEQTARWLLVGAIYTLPVALVLVLAARARLPWPLALLVAAALGAVVFYGITRIDTQSPIEVTGIEALVGASIAVAALAVSWSPRLVLTGALLGALSSLLCWQIVRDVRIDSEALSIFAIWGLRHAIIATATAAAIVLVRPSRVTR
jgi:serine/threonine protein kinase